jgi:hypothetical protein
MNERLSVGGDKDPSLEQLEKSIRDLGVTFPENWASFSERAKRLAVESWGRGGLTDLGFSTLTPDWLERVDDLGKKAEQAIQDLNREEK